MFLKQYYLECLAHASYLLGDERTGTAVVVDPQRDIDQYLKDAESEGMRIEHVFLTHFHADFLAGHLELRERTGAEIHLGARAEAEYAFTPAPDGARFRWGSLELEILETPGHTPEGISIVVYDRARDPEVPHAVLTGDTLFIGDVGRPDLMASIGVTAEELASDLYDSLHEKLLALPDATLVYPAHGAGSMCGKSLSTDTVSTIGAQRSTNYALRPMSREAFVEMSTSALPQVPAYFAYDAMLNRQERGTLEARMAELRPLSLDEVLERARADDAVVVDVRTAGAFAVGHLKGAVNIGLGGRFATWAGTIIPHESTVVLIAAPGEEGEAALRLGRIGFDRIAGFLEGGYATIDARPELIARVDRVAAEELKKLLETDEETVVLDVRMPGEWENERVAGSRNLPLNQLMTRLDEVPRTGRLVTMCRTGYRSSTAASLLLAAGFDNISDEIGGIEAWRKSGAPCSASADTPGCSNV